MAKYGFPIFGNVLQTLRHWKPILTALSDPAETLDSAVTFGDWEPQIFALTGNITAVVLNKAEWAPIGRGLTWIMFDASFTTSAGTLYIEVTLPRPHVTETLGVLMPIGSNIADASDPQDSFAIIEASNFPDRVKVFRADGINWTAAANRKIRLAGVYRSEE